MISFRVINWIASLDDILTLTIRPITDCLFPSFPPSPNPHLPPKKREGREFRYPNMRPRHCTPTCPQPVLVRACTWEWKLRALDGVCVYLYLCVTVCTGFQPVSFCPQSGYLLMRFLIDLADCINLCADQPELELYITRLLHRFYDELIESTFIPDDVRALAKHSPFSHVHFVIPARFVAKTGLFVWLMQCLHVSLCVWAPPCFVLFDFFFSLFPLLFQWYDSILFWRS